MRVPVLVPLNSHCIPVRYLKELEDPQDFGDFCPEEKIIRISKTRNKSAHQVWLTFWHELGHAALMLSGWGRVLTEEQEEAVVAALEFAWGPLMQLNPAAPGVRWREVVFPFES